MTKQRKDKDAERFDTAVAARAELVAKVRRWLPEQRLDGMTDRQVHEAVLRELQPKLDLTGRSDVYVRTYFERTTAAAPAAKTEHVDTGMTLDVRSVLDGKHAPRADSSALDSDDVEGILEGRHTKPEERFDEDDVAGILAGKYNHLVPKLKPELEPWQQPLEASRARADESNGSPWTWPLAANRKSVRLDSSATQTHAGLPWRQPLRAGR